MSEHRVETTFQWIQQLIVAASAAYFWGISKRGFSRYGVCFFMARD